jgi:hypothetical protein
MGTFVPHLRKLLLAFVSCLFYPQIFVFDMGWEWRSGLICPKLASKPRHDPPASASLVLLKVRTARAQLGFFFFFPILGLELMAFTLTYSTRPIFVKGFLR